MCIRVSSILLKISDTTFAVRKTRFTTKDENERKKEKKHQRWEKQICAIWKPFFYFAILLLPEIAVWGLSANIVHKEIHHRWWKSILNAIERNISSEFSRNIVSSTTTTTTKLLRARRLMHTENRLLHSSSSSIFAYIHRTHM